jgi:hypothetical protein
MTPTDNRNARAIEALGKVGLLVRHKVPDSPWNDRRLKVEAVLSRNRLRLVDLKTGQRLTVDADHWEIP